VQKLELRNGIRPNEGGVGQFLPFNTKNNALFNILISEVIDTGGEFVSDVAELTPINLLKTAARSSNPLSNDRAKNESRLWRRQRMPRKINWLP